MDMLIFFLILALVFGLFGLINFLSCLEGK